MLEKLHDAIAQKEVYPEQAEELNLTGYVTLQFILAASGDISHAEITKSSGFALLDQAALYALQQITPFEPAEKYIEKPENFTITIKFQ